MRLFVLFGLSLIISSCVSIRNVDLTGRDHPSGWADQIRTTGEEAYIYAQLSANAYEADSAYTLPDTIKAVRHDGVCTDPDNIGFACLVHERREGPKIVEVIIAFRGTEDGRDWWTGNIFPKQLPKSLDTYDAVKALYPNIPISVTGHSLGGGLATHVTLRRKNVDGYFFNTSPRFSRGKKWVKNRRVSIVEYGEPLKAARLFGREPTQTYTSVGCTSGGLLTQHSMRRLADCLTLAAAWGNDDALKSAQENELDVTEIVAFRQNRQQ